ncbi:MAG: DUF2782 domain-containing protein [Hahellaceae bacterium]|nr:DUF2782 domain-containing protein [Hahellaceae bacterium]MCP5209636.1 DUF2782 domain-containing protein [Hahellaceae bacterium]
MSGRLPMKKCFITMFLRTFLSMLLSLVVTFAAAEEIVVDPNEPQITIRQGKEKTFYEYRVNGILKEIKVVPKIGPEYYLVPGDGDGWIREDRSQVLVPSWVIFRW